MHIKYDQFTKREKDEVWRAIRQGGPTMLHKMAACVRVCRRISEERGIDPPMIPCERTRFHLTCRKSVCSLYPHIVRQRGICLSSEDRVCADYRPMESFEMPRLFEEK